MPLPVTHTQIENQIEDFLENVRRHGGTVGISLPIDTLERLEFYEKQVIDGSPSDGSQITITSLSDESPTTATVSTETQQMPSNETMDSTSVDEIKLIEEYAMEDGSCVVTVQEVADVLYAKHAIITGGKAKDGCPLITFPDNCTFCDLLDENYRKLMIFLTSVPSFQSRPPIKYVNSRLLEADLGFVLIVDRRNDTWNAVKTVLFKIGSYFPGLVQAVYVLRPSSFLQKAISEVRNKLFREEFKFKLIVCNSVDELHDHIDASQLTKDINGFIDYDHIEWIEQRTAVEKFSKQCRDVSQNLWQFTSRLKETELPNDVESTKELLRVLKQESEDLKLDVRNVTDQGEALLKMLRHPCTKSSSMGTSCTSSTDVCPESKLINVTTVERLLVQLEETEQGFENFWRAREDKFHQCLELRRFEHKFREIQTNLDQNFKLLNEMTEVGDSVVRVETLLAEANQFVEDSSDDLENAKQLRRIGEQLIESKHYAVDSIQPKCVELQRFCEDFSIRLQKRLDSLWKFRDLQERVERANRWCTRGVDLLAGQQLERCTSPEFARSALEEVDTFLKSSSEFKLDNPREFRNFFKDMITPETTALVQQVLKRIDDVQTMCEKKKACLQKLAEKPSRPVQPVVPEPAVPLTNSHVSVTDMLRNGSSTSLNAETGVANNSNGSWISSPSSLEWTDDPFDNENSIGGQITKKCIRKRTLPKMRVVIKEPEFSSDSVDFETLLSKQKLVTKELLITERVYVAELNSIIQGYKMEMRNSKRRGSIPEHIIGKEDVLFGNMEEIHQFHKEIFLKDLENCIDTPELIGLCFIQRKEALHSLYTIYCQNKPKSEALRMEGGDTLPFFKECQKMLGHKLPLSAYLLTPVQRITKYQLLLKDLLKYSRDGRGKMELQEAVDCMLDVLKYVNDSMHQVAITGFTGFLSDLGRLLMQGSFSVWSDSKFRDLRLKPMQRHIFLYEKAVLFCKKTGKTDDQVTYGFKHCLKTSQVGLTESVKGSKGEENRKFELWTPGRKEVYIIQASTVEVKEDWVKEIKGVLMKQFAYLKGENIKQHSSKFRKICSLNGAKPIQEDDIPYTHRSKLRHTERWDYESSIRYSSKTVSEEELRTEFCLSKRTYNLNMVSGDDRPRSHLRPRSKSMTSKTNMPCRKGDDDGNYILQDRCQNVSKGLQNDDEVSHVINERWSDVDYGFDSDEEEGDIFGPSVSGSNDHFSYFGRFVALSDYNAVDTHEITLHEGDIVELLKVGCAGWWFVRIVGTENSGWAPESYLERISKRSSRSSPSASSQDSSCSGLGNNIPRTTSKSSVTSSISGNSHGESANNS